MKYKKWFLILILVIFVLGGFGCVKKVSQNVKEEAIAKAKELFEQKKTQGLDMSAGPCLSNEIIPGWVVDVAHSPRQAIDDQPENQCSAFREGKAQHFVELDLEGNLIKVQ